MKTKIKRSFDGKVYSKTAMANNTTKSFATKHAKELRAKNIKARVVKDSYGYTVFYRKSK